MSRELDTVRRPTHSESDPDLTANSFQQKKSDPVDPTGSLSIEPPVSVVKGLKKVLFLTVAGLFFVLGVLGALLPGLPATPFLLLTSYLLVRSSPRLNQLLLKSYFLGPILRDWQIHGGVRRNVKIKAVVVVALAVAVTTYFAGSSLWVAVTILLLAAVGIVVILRLPTVET